MVLQNVILNYLIVSNIKRKLITLSSGSFKQKIFQCLKTSSYIHEDGFISLITAKKLFETIYKDLGLQAKAKATDLKDYFHVKDSDKKTKVEEKQVIDGKEITITKWKSNKGYSIIKSKL